MTLRQLFKLCSSQLELPLWIKYNYRATFKIAWSRKNPTIIRFNPIKPSFYASSNEPGRKADTRFFTRVVFYWVWKCTGFVEHTIHCFGMLGTTTFCKLKFSLYFDCEYGLLTQFWVEIPWYNIKNDAILVVDFLTPTDFSKNMRNGKKWPSNMIPVTLKDQNFLKNVLWETIYH